MARKPETCNFFVSTMFPEPPYDSRVDWYTVCGETVSWLIGQSLRRCDTHAKEVLENVDEKVMKLLAVRAAR